METRRPVVGISGASGIAYEIRVLELARNSGPNASQITHTSEPDIAIL